MRAPCPNHLTPTRPGPMRRARHVSQMILTRRKPEKTLRFTEKNEFLLRIIDRSYSAGAVSTAVFSSRISISRFPINKNNDINSLDDPESLNDDVLVNI